MNFTYKRIDEKDIDVTGDILKQLNQNAALGWRLVFIGDMGYKYAILEREAEVVKEKKK